MPNYLEEEAQREYETDCQVLKLLEEVRIWRVANSAQWVAWGIVQAKVPELDGVGLVESPTEIEEKIDGILGGKVVGTNGDAKIIEAAKDDTASGEEDEFDYLGYAQQRALFFWGDMVSL